MKQYNCDVLVCGGGPGGICAAVSAARNGADTMLIERYGYLGGMATAGLVFPFMTRFAGGEQIIDGVFQELIERLDAKGGYGGPDKPAMFDAEAFKQVADDICLESGVRLLLHTIVDGAEVVDGLIKRAIIHNKSGEGSISAAMYIDGTGDADLAFITGAPCEKGRAADGLSQPMTLNFRMCGVDKSKMPDRQQITERYLIARQEGRIDCPRNDVLWFDTMRDDEIHFNTTRIICLDATSAEDLTKAEVDSRRQVAQYVEWLVSDVEGFENAQLQMTAAQIGIRESRRVVGEYMLTADDLLSTRKFDDCIARGSYPVDIHAPDGGGTVLKHLAPGESYQIPYRSLVPKTIDNLLIAGRPISSTHEAHSAIRVMPIAAAVGEAAGAAAALCVKDGTIPRELNTDKLRSTLLAQGANLG
ncbi:MAG: FAD-dependent oxidoreductase [Armatimonadetes bacterium]|nr:FAD-dependent oxidoreductase [Armatimonadota bacterium]